MTAQWLPGAPGGLGSPGVIAAIEPQLGSRSRDHSLGSGSLLAVVAAGVLGRSAGFGSAGGSIAAGSLGFAGALGLGFASALF